MENGILSLAEIQSKYPSEWILIEDPKTDEALNVREGTVTFHSPDRDAVDRKAIESKSSRIAIHYTGEIPSDTVVIL